MCLRCSPTLPLLKDHLVCFLSLCEDDGDFQNLVWFFFHWSKFRFSVVGFVWIFNSGRDGFIPNAKSKEQSKAVLSWWIHCECWTFIFKHFQMFITLALAAPLPDCTNKCKTDFWCKCSSLYSHSCLHSGLCAARTELLLSASALRKWSLLKLQHWLPMLVSHLSCHHLGSHQGCDSLSVPYCHTFLLVFPPVSFVDDSIYCTNIVRALERLKQYRLSLITTVNVPQTWSTDQRVFICTINTNTGNPHTAVWRSAFPSQRRSLATVGFLPTCSI